MVSDFYLEYRVKFILHINSTITISGKTECRLTESPVWCSLPGLEWVFLILMRIKLDKSSCDGYRQRAGGHRNPGGGGIYQ